MSFEKKHLVIGDDSFSIDGFGRWRTSEPETVFDSKQIFDNQPLFWDDQEVSGGSTSSTHSTDEAQTTIAVADTTAGKRVRQTFMRFNYQPGKSQLIFMTGVVDDSGGGAGITRGWGIFDDDNGLFLQDSEGTYQFVRRTNVTGSAVDNAVTQANWNIDKMDGTGVSGVTLDFTKTQILVIDFEWLGVGRVRLGFAVDGLVYYAHEFLNANVLTEVYMSTPNLPLRYEIENDGTGAASGLMHICSTVISEGGSEDLGVLGYGSTSGTHVDMATENQIYAAIGIRLKSTHLAAAVKLVSISMLETTGSKQFEWILILNPTVANAFVYSNQSDSAIQVATGASTNTVSGGRRLTGGFLNSAGNQGGNAGAGESGIENAILLGSAIDGTPDEIVLCARPVAGSTAIDIEGSITWRELT